MIYAAPSSTVEIVADGFATGLAGTLGYRVRDNQGADSIARTTAGVSEDIATSGIYRAQFTAPTTAGQYTVVWDDGSGKYATEELVVTSSAAAIATPAGSDLCTVADVKASMEPAITTASRDPMIQTAITAASRRIMSWCDREFAPAGSAGVTRRFPVDVTQNANGGYVADLAPFDLRTATAVSLHPETTSPITLSASNADYALEPLPNRDGTYYRLRVSPYFSMISSFADKFNYALLDVTGTWGFASVPEDVSRACVLTVRSWIRQNPAAYAFPDQNTVEGVQPEAPQTFTLPGGALMLLDHYKRWGV